MSSETAILVQEKISFLEGSIRQLKDEKLELQAEIDLLKKEKEILMKALNQLTALEDKAENLQNKNVLLESQLSSLLAAIETMERDKK